jgi:hypothetical protein
MEQAKALKEQGNQLYKQEKFTEALQKYTEASALQPQDPGSLSLFLSSLLSPLSSLSLSSLSLPLSPSLSPSLSLGLSSNNMI